MNRRRWIYSAGLLAATLGLGAAPAGAQTTGGVNAANVTGVTIAFTPDNITPTGVTVTVTGTIPFGPVTLLPSSSNCFTIVTGQTAYVQNGNDATMTLNLALKDAPRGGTDSYIASDGRNAAVTSNSLTCPAVAGVVVENPTTGDPATEVLDTNTAPGSNLPRTGSDIKAPIGLALVLVASGGALVLGTRKARKAAVRVED